MSFFRKTPNDRILDAEKRKAKLKEKINNLDLFDPNRSRKENRYRRQIEEQDAIRAAAERDMILSSSQTSQPPSRPQDNSKKTNNFSLESNVIVNKGTSFNINLPGSKPPRAKAPKKKPTKRKK